MELTLQNTEGGHAYDKTRQLYYANTDVFLICFSIDQPESLRNIPVTWKREVSKFCPNAPIILVGTKQDLRNVNSQCAGFSFQTSLSPIVTVKYEDGQEMAEQIGAYSYQECSAKRNEGVREVFKMATWAAMAPSSINRFI